LPHVDVLTVTNRSVKDFGAWGSSPCRRLTVTNRSVKDFGGHGLWGRSSQLVDGVVLVHNVIFVEKGG